MGYTFRHLLFQGFLLISSVLFLASSFVQAQDWRLSGSYSIQSVGFNYVPSRTYSGEINAASKGMVEIELERYLLYRLYIAGKTEFILHNQQDILIGGPVNFQQVNVGAILGLQWPKWGIYGGVKAGRVWDFNIRATDAANQPLWVAPVEETSAFTTSLTGGIKYYLFNFLRLQAEVTQTANLPQNIKPESSFTVHPAFRSFDFSPLSFSVGISLSIPWNKPAKKSAEKKGVKLPPLMRLSGVHFSKPLKNTFVTSKFGHRWRSTHEGVDLNANIRDKIMAAEKGIVVKAGSGRGYGKMVRIKHPQGFETVYAHMNRVSVKEGERVRKGQVIGRAGNTGTSTGVHLHFEILKDGKPVNPLSYVRF